MSSLAVLNLVWCRTGTMQRDWSSSQDGESGRDRLTSFYHGGMALKGFATVCCCGLELTPYRSGQAHAPEFLGWDAELSTRGSWNE